MCFVPTPEVYLPIKSQEILAESTVIICFATFCTETHLHHITTRRGPHTSTDSPLPILFTTAIS